MIKNIRSIFSVFIVAASLTGCGAMDGLISNEQVSNADNNQVVTVGDSIFALSGKIQDNLEEKAGETFRQYTLSGAYLEGGIISELSVPEQFDLAVSHNSDIKTLIMDASGNDILVSAIAGDFKNCKTQWYQFGHLSSKCKNQINDLYVLAVNFLNDVDAAGVENVIHLGYYHTKNGVFLLDSMEEAIDYGDKKLSEACANSTANCTFVDPRSAMRDSNIIVDGIHPSSDGSEKLANLIWPVLEPLL